MNQPRFLCLVIIGLSGIVFGNPPSPTSPSPIGNDCVRRITTQVSRYFWKLQSKRVDYRERNNLVFADIPFPQLTTVYGWTMRGKTGRISQTREDGRGIITEYMVQFLNSDGNWIFLNNSSTGKQIFVNLGNLAIPDTITSVTLANPVKTLVLRVIPELWDGVPFMLMSVQHCGDPVEGVQRPVLPVQLTHNSIKKNLEDQMRKNSQTHASPARPGGKQKTNQATKHRHRVHNHHGGKKGGESKSSEDRQRVHHRKPKGKKSNHKKKARPTHRVSQYQLPQSAPRPTDRRHSPDGVGLYDRGWDVRRRREQKTTHHRDTKRKRKVKRKSQNKCEKNKKRIQTKSKKPSNKTTKSKRPKTKTKKLNKTKHKTKKKSSKKTKERLLKKTETKKKIKRPRKAKKPTKEIEKEEKKPTKENTKEPKKPIHKTNKKQKKPIHKTKNKPKKQTIEGKKELKKPTHKTKKGSKKPTHKTKVLKKPTKETKKEQKKPTQKTKKEPKKPTHKTKKLKKPMKETRKEQKKPTHKDRKQQKKPPHKTKQEPKKPTNKTSKSKTQRKESKKLKKPGHKNKKKSDKSKIKNSTSKNRPTAKENRNMKPGTKKVKSQKAKEPAGKLQKPPPTGKVQVTRPYDPKAAPPQNGTTQTEVIAPGKTGPSPKLTEMQTLAKENLDFTKSTYESCRLRPVWRYNKALFRPADYFRARSDSRQAWRAMYGLGIQPYRFQIPESYQKSRNQKYYLEIDFRRITSVFGLKVAGSSSQLQWGAVTRFSLFHKRKDSQPWQGYVDRLNQPRVFEVGSREKANAHVPAVFKLDIPITAKALRIYPERWASAPLLMIDLITCETSYKH